jgi:2-polyprenyl-6-methoxyphenol hydroxylase-like FAD-dependent oxidoreductase
MTLDSVEPFDPSKPSTVDDHAVVVGGSMAGLLAARVLDDYYERVTVFERDPFPDVPTARTGAPQTSHPHAMLEAGRAVLSDLFPGFEEELHDNGGLTLDAATEMTYYDKGGFVADGPDPLPMWCASRALFEHVTRERVREREGIDLHGETNFTGYELEGDTVTGVTVRDDGEVRTVDADLVVDATGRTSRTPQWLEANGYEPPEVDEVEVDVTYSTIRLDRPEDDRRAIFAPVSPPRKRGFVFLPIEGGEWEVIAGGIHGDDAPTERDQYVEFVESGPVDEMAHLLREREWTSDIHHYPFPASRWRHYEELDRFPDGLVVTGDAIASFNPIYGQGMSVAALDALALHHELADGADDLGPRFFDRASRSIDTVWQVAVGADFEFTETTGPKPPGTDLFNRYVDRLLRQAHSDPVLSDAFNRVLRLERRPTSLLRPGILWRVLRPQSLPGISAGQPTTDAG